jgi:hypothetical protein
MPSVLHANASAVQMGAHGVCHAGMGESFLLLFFKKEALAFP